MILCNILKKYIYAEISAVLWERRFMLARNRHIEVSSVFLIKQLGKRWWKKKLRHKAAENCSSERWNGFFFSKLRQQVVKWAILRSSVFSNCWKIVYGSFNSSDYPMEFKLLNVFIYSRLRSYFRFLVRLLIPLPESSRPQPIRNHPRKRRDHCNVRRKRNGSEKNKLETRFSKSSRRNASESRLTISFLGNSVNW